MALPRAAAAALLLVAAAAPSAQGQAQLLRTTDGRIVAVAGIVPAVVQDNAGYAMALGREALFLALAGDASRLVEEQALDALSLLPAETVRAILEQEEPLPEATAPILASDPMLALRAGIARDLTPFQRRRVADRARAELDAMMAAQPLPETLPLRVYCSFYLGDYDFDAGRFPLSQAPGYERETCGNPYLQLPLGLLSEMSADLAGFPDVVELPPDAAEALLLALKNDPGAMLAYDAELSARWDTSDPRLSKVSLTLVGRPPYSLTPGDDPFTVVHQLEARPEETPPAQLLTWDLHDPAALAELAGLAAPLEIGARVPRRGGAGWAPLGRISTRTGGAASEDDPSRMTPFSIGPHDATALGEALELPPERLLLLQGDTFSGDVGTIVGLLPAPVSAYEAPVPVAVEAGSVVSVLVDFDVEGAWLRNGDLLLLAVRPSAAGLVPDHNNEIFAEFPLPDATR